MNVSAADKRGTVENTTRRQREVDVRDDEVRVRLQKGRGRDEEAHILAAAPSSLLSSPDYAAAIRSTRGCTVDRRS